MVICLLAFAWPAVAQDTTAIPATKLGLQEAVGLALQNNYNILLAKDLQQIAKNNVTVGNAGMLPTVTGSVSSSNSLLNRRQDNSNGDHVDVNNQNNFGLNYGVTLNWKLFDGLAMFANYNQFKAQNELAQLAEQDSILQTIADVIIGYYDMASQQQQLKATQEALATSRIQLTNATDKFNVGRASRLEVLNAQVNLNTDTSTYLNQLQTYQNSQIQLNQLMARDLTTAFSVSDTIDIDSTLKLVDVLDQAQSGNVTLLSAQVNKRLADIALKQTRATRYPSLGVSLGYNFADSRTPSEFIQQQHTNGLYYGFGVSINIFDGLNQWRKEKNAKLQIDIANQRQNRTLQGVNAQVSTLYVTYASGLGLVKLEQQNVESAKQNLNITLEKYKVGNITPLELREAQRNYLDAQSRYASAQFQTKLAEIMLKETTGKGIPLQ